MNPQEHENRNDPRLDALLDEALTSVGDVDAAWTARMTDRIMAATVDQLPKSRLVSLLDEALAAPAPPAGLVERTLRATRDVGRGSRDVLARIGPFVVRRAWASSLAAAVVLMATVAIGVITNGIAKDVQSVGTLKQEFATLASYRPPGVAVDGELEMLGAQIDQALAMSDWYTASRVSLEPTIYDLEMDLNDMLF